jgi:hypothetical protein
MSPAELDHIERDTGKRLPAEYWQLLGQFPNEIGDWGQDGYLLLDSSAIIGLNRQIRSRPVYGMDWPDDYFVIGEDGLGDFFCIDLTKSPSPVLFDHEMSDFTKQADSVDAGGSCRSAEQDGRREGRGLTPRANAKRSKLVERAGELVNQMATSISARDLPALRRPDSRR